MFSENEDEEQGNARRCRNCNSNLNLGNEFLSVEEGVIGKNGPVPLEPTRMFCSIECMTDFYADNAALADDTD